MADTMRSAIIMGLIALAGCARPTPSVPATPVVTPPAAYDVVIRNGRVLDGAGNPWILADVAIRAGRFAKIGVVPERGTTEIDARGLYVSPGWIDVMDQSGAALRRNGLAENKLRMGVTTAIGGEGGTPVPAGQIPAYFRELETQGSASTSALTTARHRREPSCWATPAARPRPTSWRACGRWWTRRCAPAPWG